MTPSTLSASAIERQNGIIMVTLSKPISSRSRRIAWHSSSKPGR
jgi:hypothetical protein